MCTSGFHNVRRMLRSLEASRALQRLWKDWKPHPMRTAWGHWVCLAWRKEGWEKASFFYHFMRRGSEKGSASPPSLVTNGRRHRTAQSCTRGVRTAHEEKHLYWEGDQTQTGFPRVDAPCLFVLKRNLDNALSNMLSFQANCSILCTVQIKCFIEITFKILSSWIQKCMM